MIHLRKPDWAIQAVAARFSAAWQTCNAGATAGFLTIDGERIAVEIAMIAPKKTAPDSPTRPRLRFDRVALGFMARLRAGLSRGPGRNSRRLMLNSNPLQRQRIFHAPKILA